MAAGSKTKVSSKETASVQLDLFAESNKMVANLGGRKHDFESESSEIDELLQTIFVRYKSNERISTEDVQNCQTKINALVAHIEHERNYSCKRLETPQRSFVSSFSILPVKSPRDHLKQANILVDGRAKDWEKVNSDLKLAFYKTASDTVKGVFLKPRKRMTRKYAG